jgi:hypothetical protein
MAGLAAGPQGQQAKVEHRLALAVPVVHLPAVLVEQPVADRRSAAAVAAMARPLRPLSARGYSKRSNVHRFGRDRLCSVYFIH